MKAGIHPVYEVREFHCYGCGIEWETRTTIKPSTSDGKVHLDICSNCHPFFTGKQKLIDKAGRVERFMKRYRKTDPKAEAAAAETAETAEAVAAPVEAAVAPAAAPTKNGTAKSKK
ncbi:MAG: 50S ribosomal protein L31 [Candidatus Eisenbacteria bacterium]|uniref:Large ribosomal subunit protein bL31 n=1 Tax=Eiseniibacteriota bacterium TaxID=2212470 RepID=A0A849SNW3_UNCEI|nr:50S ribosomal protein L31 [Candidatus Eisenbacteria bacterium]